MATAAGEMEVQYPCSTYSRIHARHAVGNAVTSTCGILENNARISRNVLKNMPWVFVYTYEFQPATVLFHNKQCERVILFWSTCEDTAIQKVSDRNHKHLQSKIAGPVFLIDSWDIAFLSRQVMLVQRNKDKISNIIISNGSLVPTS